jgi:hypothetical protein
MSLVTVPLDIHGSTHEQALAILGQICTYKTKVDSVLYPDGDGCEYGRIVAFNSVDLIVERLQKTPTDTFIVHPSPFGNFSAMYVPYMRPATEVRLIPGAIGPELSTTVLREHDPNTGRFSLREV